MPELDRADDGSIELRLEEYEAEIIRRLCGEMRLLLEADLPRADAVTDRLFPRAHEDQKDEEAYRKLVGSTLRDYKLEALEAVETDVGDDGPATATLEGEGRERWLTFLTDTRLALGTRLEVTEETMSQEPDPDSPDAVALSVLHWVGWIQEQILEKAMEDS
ncbi:MAG: DUF2017 family protein [Actinobacteria bacterium]|nr:DUF2017 family protein [Actinomycetota bacterium]